MKGRTRGIISVGRDRIISTWTPQNGGGVGKVLIKKEKGDRACIITKEKTKKSETGAKGVRSKKETIDSSKRKDRVYLKGTYLLWNGQKLEMVGTKNWLRKTRGGTRRKRRQNPPRKQRVNQRKSKTK